MTLLGKETIWTKIQMVLLFPLWAIMHLDTNGNSKTFDEFRYGLISHKCEFDYDVLTYAKGTPYYKCKHFGCGIVSCQTPDGKWLPLA